MIRKNKAIIGCFVFSFTYLMPFTETDKYCRKSPKKHLKCKLFTPHTSFIIRYLLEIVILQSEIKIINVLNEITMTIKEKVLASAKTSFAKYGLKKDELSKLVDQIVASRGLTDESKDEDVTGAIMAFEPVVGLMQSMYNRATSEANKKYEGWIDPNDPNNKPQLPTPPVPPTSNLTLEQVQKMIADSTANNQKAVADAVAAALAPYKEKEEKAHLASILQSSDKLKDIPEQFRSRYQLDKEENLDSTVQKIVDDWTGLRQTLVASGQFVEAPKTSTMEDEQSDFAKAMAGFSERNAPQK